MSEAHQHNFINYRQHNVKEETITVVGKLLQVLPSVYELRQYVGVFLCGE